MEVFIGPIIHSVLREKVSIIPNGFIVSFNGKIQEINETVNLSSLKNQYPDAKFTTLSAGQFLIPGLIDSHIHAPQFPNAGLGYDKPLLEWLEAYTFPLEAQYADVNFAIAVYKDVVRRTLACGTTCAVYFGTVHRGSTEQLARAVVSAGQRALVGKVCMDCNCPPELQETTDSSLDETEAFVDSVLAMESSLVAPVVTPRFAVTCSGSLLAQLGEIAHRRNLHVQTHLSENKGEVEFVRKSFPEAKNYTDVYDSAKLLTKKTILAHSVFLSDDELAVIRASGSSVAHCASSNFLLQSGLCDVKRMLDAGVNVALGTDVAGGCSVSVLDSVRSALTASLCLSFAQPGYKPLTYYEAFYLATLGGAIALDMEDKLGNFEVGKFFDAVIVDTKIADSPIYYHSELTLSELFQKFIYTGDDRNIRKVYVNGKLVVDKS